MSDVDVRSLMELAVLHAAWKTADEAWGDAESEEEHTEARKRLHLARWALHCWPRLNVCQMCLTDDGAHSIDCPKVEPK